MERDFMILCANMVRRKDRRFWIEQKYPEIRGEKVQIVEAIDGRGISQEKLKRYPEGTNPSNYAVRLTKLIALRRFLHSSRSHLLYLEDDVYLAPEFDETLGRALSCDTDLVFLGADHIEEPISGEEWDQCQYPFNNHAVLLTRKGAKKVRRMLLEWKMPQSDVEIALNIRFRRLVALSPRKLVAFQRKGRSDNCGHSGQFDLAQGISMDLTPDDLAVLDAALVGCTKVLEWGSGGSTAFIARTLGAKGRIVSVEHNPNWGSQTVRSLKGHRLYNAEILIRPPMAARPIEMYGWFSDRELRDYINAPDEVVGSNEVDLVLVDGRQRIECALTAVKWLRKGGYLLIHDFWPRHRYRVRLPELLEHFDYLLESPCLEDTQGMALFQKK